MTKLYRILGKRGRITIPYEIRKRVGFSYNDILSFAEQDDRTVIVRREKLCNDCRKAPGTPDKPEPEGITLLDFLDHDAFSVHKGFRHNAGDDADSLQRISRDGDQFKIIFHGRVSFHSEFPGNPAGQTA